MPQCLCVRVYVCAAHKAAHSLAYTYVCQAASVCEYVCICMLYLCTRTPSVCKRVPGPVYECTHICIHTAASAASQHIP